MLIQLYEENEILINDRGDCNHIQNVYRLNVGDSLRVIDGEYEYATEITGIGKKEIKLKIIDTSSYIIRVEINFPPIFFSLFLTFFILNFLRL